MPQIFVNLDRDKAKALGVPVNQVFDAMQSTLVHCMSMTSINSYRTFRVKLRSRKLIFVLNRKTYGMSMFAHKTAR